jgi:hypothetical protein
MGFGVLGIGPNPHPQSPSPIPNPQSPNFKSLTNFFYILKDLITQYKREKLNNNI